MKLLLSLLALPALSMFAASVDFPGPPPGQATASMHGSLFTLENQAVSASWKMSGEHFQPAVFTDKLTGREFDQPDSELFRLALTAPPERRQPGYYVAIRLGAEKVVAMASTDGRTWTDLASFKRTAFPGEPKLVRIGKMDAKAQPHDWTGGPHGAIGEGTISDFLPAALTLPGGKFAFKTGANQAAVTEFPFPSGSTQISCRIDKGTDEGQSWGPALALVWEDGKRFMTIGVRDKAPIFNIRTAAGEQIISHSPTPYPAFDLPASMFHLLATPKFSIMPANPAGVRVAERIRGVGLDADFASDTGIHAHWHAELRDGSNYVRQRLDLSAPGKSISLQGVELIDLHIPDAETIGTAPGCPVCGDNVFMGVEMPGAQNAISGGEARIGFSSNLQLSSGQSYSFGAVTGVAAENQLRRSFLYYIERERARPSKPFLHYNCWFDLCTNVSAAGILDVVNQFNEQMVKKRGVPVQSFLVDDGWDDPAKGLWTENQKKFPGGFAALKKKMDPLNAHLAIWISPLGGYNGVPERTADAVKLGLIPPGGKLDFGYPAYKEWFQNRCLQLMREDGVNAFKWDKAGDGVSPHFMALLDIADHLRMANPDVFINVTVGTWPSPFWLNHVDSTWRNGSADVALMGKGDNREKWLTFRDGYCRSHFVTASPLYPLNSVMHHGIVEGRYYQGATVAEAGPNLRNEARSYFANGATLQELYITPSMMTPEAWDDVADAAKWAHANADVLVDSHWVGGDPLRLDPYGYAAWNRRKGTLMIRNPDDKPESITLEAGSVFDLPAGAPQRYAMQSPYKDQRIQQLELDAGTPVSVTLQPFEVLVFDANSR